MLKASKVFKIKLEKILKIGLKNQFLFESVKFSINSKHIITRFFAQVLYISTKTHKHSNASRVTWFLNLNRSKNSRSLFIFTQLGNPNNEG